MAKKFYAIRKGIKPGIYTSWDECNKYIKGFSGAEYKGFATKEEAEVYLNLDKAKQESSSQSCSISIDSNTMSAYVDGSFNNDTKEFSYGAVIFWNGQQYTYSEKFNDCDLAEMRNVAGELKGAERAIKFALDNNVKHVILYHDYEGIAKWCTGEWKARKVGTISYKDYYDSVKDKVDIQFKKVKAHSGNTYNELADKLAKEAMDKPVTILKKTEVIKKDIKEQIRKESACPVFINREQLEDIILKAGEKEWDSFKYSGLSTVGIAKRCVFFVDDRKATLDFFFRSDGKTTIKSVSSNSDLSNRLKSIIEDEYSYKDTGENRSHSLQISLEWLNKLIDFMQSLENVRMDREEHNNPKYTSYKFESTLGDRITFNIYNTGRLVIQGKPAYLYSEAMSLLSYCPEVSIEDVVETNNKMQNVDIKCDDIREEIRTVMPMSYDNIDDTIFKILSPSFTLKKINVELEDYSCFAFPALRALEGYLKYLFELKGIIVGHNFGPQYDYNKGNGQYYLKGDVSQEVNDSRCVECMELIYNYFHENRHTLFHAEQILISSRILEDKIEANLIINQVINMIEQSYIKITT